jgi:plasmid stabilization system protein ParE
MAHARMRHRGRRAARTRGKDIGTACASTGETPRRPRKAREKVAVDAESFSRNG